MFKKINQAQNEEVPISQKNVYDEKEELPSATQAFSEILKAADENPINEKFKDHKFKVDKDAGNRLYKKK